MIEGGGGFDGAAWFAKMRRSVLCLVQGRSHGEEREDSGRRSI